VQRWLRGLQLVHAERFVLDGPQIVGLAALHGGLSRTRMFVLREPAARDEHGRPLCSYCRITDPANRETCLGSSRRRPVSVCTLDGPLCQERPQDR
jgi:hypothetical protein